MQNPSKLVFVQSFKTIQFAARRFSGETNFKRPRNAMRR